MEPDDTGAKPTPGDGMSSLRQLGEEAGLALGLLTRFSLPRFEVQTSASLASSFWAFPLVGACVGIVGSVAMMIAELAGLGSFTAVVFALTAMVFTTGALHEDGLADFCDGLGGGRDRTHKLEVMRDSRIGTYGALALMLCLALQGLLLVEVIASAGLFAAAAVLVAVSAMARLAVAVPLYLLKSARQEGLAHSLGNPSPVRLAAAVIIAMVIAIIGVGWGAAWSLFIGAGIGGSGVALTAHRHLDGYTGDVFGATVVVANITALTVYILAVLVP